MTLEVRDVRGQGELRACQQLQRRAWGITEDGYLVPVATLAAAQKMGGAVLGAFEGERLVGFTFAFLGRYRDGPLTLYSQLAATDPERQGQGVGRVLKQAQRERARALGLGSVTWTFDPLQAANAAFNLGVLGAQGIAYEPDLYGMRSDLLNAGLATDRMVVQWSTTAETPGTRARRPSATAMFESAPISGTPFRTPGAVRSLSGSEHAVEVEIPSRLAETKAHDVELSRAWQAAVREALVAAFGAGYRADGFASEGGRSFLLLSRGGER